MSRDLQFYYRNAERNAPLAVKIILSARMEENEKTAIVLMHMGTRERNLCTFILKYSISKEMVRKIKTLP